VDVGAQCCLTVTPFVMTMSGMRTEKIEVRVEPEELGAFVAAAKSEGLSLSAWIRRLLLLHLKRPEN
jgi:predicted HicB family RNase H-like nuclease